MRKENLNLDYIALVGAYERDNFGDLLFLEVCKKLLSPWPTVALSLISSDMKPYGGEHVISASAWFECTESIFPPSAAIIVGGEVLDCPLNYSLACDLTKERSDFFSSTPKNVQHRIGATVAWRSSNLAYVPNFSTSQSPIKAIPFALNSVGGSTLTKNSPNYSSAEIALRQARFVSARDKTTYDIITPIAPDRNFITLSPDIVNALPKLFKAEIDQCFSTLTSDNNWPDTPYILFQANDLYIKNENIENISTALANAAMNQNLSVVFQPAGTAPGHDSIEALTKLAEATTLKLRGSSIEAYLQLDRNLWLQVAAISHAACYVGTSLHGRIVSSAFARPRVSLENQKVSRYARTWEETDLQPHGTKVEQLNEAIEKAITTPPSNLSSFAECQSKLALDAFDNLKSSLGIARNPFNLETTKERIEFFKLKSTLFESEILRNRLIDLEFQLYLDEKQIKLIRHELDGILRSPSWRITSPLRALKNLVRSKKS